MPERVRAIFLIDILIAIDKIRRFSAPYSTGNQLLENEIAYDAVMRELQIIGEAVHYYLNRNPVNPPEYFRQVVDFRNVITHGYFGIDIDEVWSVITEHLVPLGKDIHQLLKNESEQEIVETIDASIAESKENGQLEVTKYLKDLKNCYIR